MNGRQKLEATEKREELFAAAWWSCCVCKRPLGVVGSSQLAHRVIKSKHNLEKYGPEVIHHPLNMVPVDCLKCNSAVILNGLPAKALLDRIIRVTTGTEPEPNMRDEYRALRAEFENGGTLDGTI